MKLFLLLPFFISVACSTVQRHSDVQSSQATVVATDPSQETFDALQETRFSELPIQVVKNRLLEIIDADGFLKGIQKPDKLKLVEALTAYSNSHKTPQQVIEEVLQSSSSMLASEDTVEALQATRFFELPIQVVEEKLLEIMNEDSFLKNIEEADKLKLIEALTNFSNSQKSADDVILDVLGQ